MAKSGQTGTAVAILPARGGSKRIPMKNIRPFHGRPMIAWPIAAARDSGLFARIVVSTDDARIAEAAREAGAEVPFLRAPELADDHTGTTDVVRDAISRLGLGAETEVCCIYPTAVFVEPGDLVEGSGKLGAGARWVLSLAPHAAPIQRAYRRDRDAGFVPVDAAQMPKRTQDLDPAYYDCGQFYWARAGTWSDPDAHVWDGADGVLIPRARAVDIDDEADWHLAERLYAARG